MKDLINKLARREDLNRSEVDTAVESILSGSSTVEEQAEFLLLLRDKGERPAEIAAFAECLIKHAVDPLVSATEAIDVCGTGGDGLNFFNISTTVMFVVAACGLPVVKHGNRGITSQSGGADVLEALGVNIHLPRERNREALEKAGCLFLFAPDYHPAIKAVMPVRKRLAEQGRKTVFNLLGPLLNPARPAYQLTGIYDRSLLADYARTMGLLGRVRAWVVHGEHGEDEVSLAGSTHVAVWDGKLAERSVTPSEAGLRTCALEALRGGDAAENAEVILGILNGSLRDERRDCVLLNAAAALVTAGREPDLRAGVRRAEEALDEGAALQSLEALRRL